MLFVHQQGNSQHAIITEHLSYLSMMYNKKTEETAGQESWRTIPDDFFKKLQKRLPKRVQAVFEH